jgi:DNA-binding SARP family transcriptional activator
MLIRALGPLEVRIGAMAVPLGPPKQRTVFALLALSAGRLVPVADLVDELWSDPPRSAVANVRTYAANLRRAFAASGLDRIRLDSVGPGYVLRVDPAEVDLLVFAREAADARALARPDAAAADLARAADHCAAALALWRGEPLADVVPGAALSARATALRAERAALVEDHAEIGLRLGRAGALVPALREHTLAHPLRERGWRLLMTALWEAGDPAEALSAYGRARAALVDQLGIEPGERLRALHRRILGAADHPGPAAAAAGRPSAVGPAAPAVRPAQLPAAPGGFVGRSGEVARLDALLAGVGAGPGAVVISAVSGMAGVGKTSLALHWAHRVADRFPDGQLYVDLRGFDPDGRTVSPAEAVRGFLDALDVPPSRVPADLDARVGLYRSLLAGRRMLVVLDNARNADQVRALLPGTPSALAVVTSRDQLLPLVATGAHPVALDLLSTEESHALLTDRLGGARTAAEPAAVETIVGACAGLPLALAIAAARAGRAGSSLTAVAAELADVDRRLDELDAGDLTTQVRAVFGASYATLSAPAAALFRLLGPHPGPDISAAAAASLAGRPAAVTRALLGELTRASLLAEHRPGRYAGHDLLRAYGAELATRHDPAGRRRAALRRLLDHYTHTAVAADRLLRPHRDPVALPLAPPVAGAVPEPLADREAATGWLIAEQPVLLAALARAADAGFDAHTVQLAWALDTFLDWRGHWPELVTAWQAAVRAAGRLGDPLVQGYAYRLLARGETALNHFAPAHAAFRHALDLYARAGDRVGEADTHRTYSYLSEREGDLAQAIGHTRRALAGYGAAGHRRGQAYCLNGLGWYHALRGEYGEALERCREALALLESLGDRYGQACAWDSLGYAQHHLGRYADAADCYGHAVALRRGMGARHDEAASLTRLGDAHHAAGDRVAAGVAWRSALDILDDVGPDEAAALRARLGDRAAAPAPAPT